MSVTKEKGPIRMFTQCVVYKRALLLFCLSTCLCMLFSHKAMWFACVEASQCFWFILTQLMCLMPIWNLEVFCPSGSFGVFFLIPPPFLTLIMELKIWKEDGAEIRCMWGVTSFFVLIPSLWTMLQFFPKVREQSSKRRKSNCQCRLVLSVSL